MPTYVYETVPTNPDTEPRRFELKQSIVDAALTHDPETGEAVIRIMLGGIPYAGARKSGHYATGHGADSGCCPGAERPPSPAPPTFLFIFLLP